LENTEEEPDPESGVEFEFELAVAPKALLEPPALPKILLVLALDVDEVLPFPKGDEVDVPDPPKAPPLPKTDLEALLPDVDVDALLLPKADPPLPNAEPLPNGEGTEEEAALFDDDGCAAPKTFNVGLIGVVD
jgi:hypothetical protein